MFDISFWELAIVGVVALIVIGPERLPGVARTAGHLFGRFQRYVASVRSDIQREIDASEIAKVKQEVSDAARVFETSVQEHASAFQSDVQAMDRSLAAKDGAPALPAPGAVAADAPAAAATQAEILASQEAAFAAPPAPEAVRADLPGVPANESVFTQGPFDFGVEPVRVSPARSAA
jgi:sec-independent protein translocase protein TatB